MPIDNCPKIGLLRLDTMEPEVPGKITLIFPETGNLYRQEYSWFPCSRDGVALLSRAPGWEPKRIISKIYSVADFMQWIRSITADWNEGHSLATPRLEIIHSRYVAGRLAQFGGDELRQKVRSVIEQELAELMLPKNSEGGNAMKY